MTNKKLLFLPITLLTTTMLFAGCTQQSTPDPTPVPSASSTDELDDSQIVTGEIEIPDSTSAEYEKYTQKFQTTSEFGWEYPNAIGAKKYTDDPTKRPTNLKNWQDVRGDNSDAGITKFDIMYYELLSDVEESALKVSTYLAENPEATLKTIPDDLIITRYDKLVKNVVKQDKSSNFYYVVAQPLEGGNEITIGAVVPQEGITPPNLEAPEGDTVTEVPADELPTEG
jgi:hypothetical protein